ncbi:MAG: tetratricopeptide repeat protein, partial [Sandaracinaceae bacterium]
MRALSTITVLALLVGCGGISQEQAMRSQREYDLAVGLYGEQDTAGAFEHLLEAIELDPDNAEAHLLLGNLFMIVRQDFAQAEHHMREA